MPYARFSGQRKTTEKLVRLHGYAFGARMRHAKIHVVYSMSSANLCKAYTISLMSNYHQKSIQRSNNHKMIAFYKKYDKITIMVKIQCICIKPASFHISFLLLKLNEENVK